MNLSIVKNNLSSKIGKKYCFKYISSRNQVDEFYGIITKLYPSIFIVLCSSERIRSFSYNDLIIGALKIIE